MALKTFNVRGGLGVGSKGEIFDANANLNLSNSIANVTLGNVSNLHISGGNANSAILGSVTLNGDGNVTAIAISSRGDGYTIAPTITISGANSVEANATVSLFANGALNTITINNPGTGYSSGTVSAVVSGPSSRYLKTDGVGNLSWFEVQGTSGGGGGGTPGGSNTYIQFNDNGAFNGTDGFIFDKVTNAITAGGTITATNFSGANLKNGNSEVAIASNANVVTSANGNVVLTVTSSGDGNLRTTGVNVAGYVNATGNIISANFVGKLANGNSNVSIAANANVTISSNGQANIITVNSDGTNGLLVVTGNANISGTANVVGNANVGNLGTATAVITTGNITTVNTGLVQNGNSNIAITSNANVTITAKSNATMVISDTGANITGTGNFSGNLTAANFIGKFANGNSNIAINTNANITLTANSNSVVVVTSSGDGNLQTTGGNVTGYWNVSGNIIGANLVGTLANGNSNIRISANSNVGISANGQSNVLLITSNGTHAQSTFQNDLTITGNLTVQGNAIYANTESLTIEDPIISLGTGANNSTLVTDDGKDRGVELHTYGNGAAYTTSGSTPSGNTTIVLTSTSGIVAGQLVTFADDPNAIPVGTTVSTVNAGNIVISNATTNTIAGTSTLQIGNDILRFMGWSNANAEFQFYSSASITNEIVTGTLGNVNASTFIGALQGNLVNGNSNVSVAANSNVTIGVTGNAAVLTATSSNVIFGNGVGAILTSNNGTGIRQVQLKTSTDANFSANYSITLPVNDGAANQFLQTDGSGVTSWKTLTTIASEYHVATNGDDTTGNGSVINPYLTIGKAVTVATQIHDVIVVHPGTYTENVTVTSNSLVITSTNQAEDVAYLNGNLVFSGSASYNYVNGMKVNNLTHSASGSLYLYHTVVGTTAIPGTVTKSGSGYLEVNDSDWQTGNIANGVLTAVNVTGTGTIDFNGVHVYNLTVNNSGAVVYVDNSPSAANTTLTAGNLIIADSLLVSFTNGGNALTATGGIVQLQNTGIIYPNAAPGKLNIGASAFYGYSAITFDRPNSTLSGTSISSTTDSQNIRTDGVKTTDSVTFVTANTSANISNVGAATLTTTTTTANQAIVKVSAANGRAVEFIIKGIDSTGLKYSAATILALIGNAANADCEFTTFAQLNTGLTTGEITVALTDSNANITLQVTPASTNSTVWTTQYRVI